MIFLLFCIFLSLVNAKVKLQGRYEIVDGIEIVFQYPNNSPVGLVFLAHGCSHSATDWWPKSISCPTCIGLPIEISITKSFLENDYMVISVSSTDRDSKCWGNADISRVTKTLHKFGKDSPTSDTILPIYLVGVSSGGSFVGIFSQQNTILPIKSVCVMISAPPIKHIKNQIPPTMFILMEKDQYTKNLVSRSLTKYQESEILVTQEMSITPEYFNIVTENMISLEKSRELYGALKDSKIINPHTGLLYQDPRASDWRSVIY